MVKGIINAFDNKEFVFGPKSDIGSKLAVIWPSLFATRYFSFATTF